MKDEKSLRNRINVLWGGRFIVHGCFIVFYLEVYGKFTTGNIKNNSKQMNEFNAINTAHIKNAGNKLSHIKSYSNPSKRKQETFM